MATSVPRTNGFIALDHENMSLSTFIFFVLLCGFQVFLRTPLLSFENFKTEWHFFASVLFLITPFLEFKSCENYSIVFLISFVSFNCNERKHNYNREHTKTHFQKLYLINCLLKALLLLIVCNHKWLSVSCAPGGGLIDALMHSSKSSFESFFL